MPRSRRELATTLAPRSWPSRPGLATRTRIFRSAMGREDNAPVTSAAHASLRAAGPHPPRRHGGRRGAPVPRIGIRAAVRDAPRRGDLPGGGAHDGEGRVAGSGDLRVRRPRPLPALRCAGSGARSDGGNAFLRGVPRDDGADRSAAARPLGGPQHGDDPCDVSPRTAPRGRRSGASRRIPPGDGLPAGARRALRAADSAVAVAVAVAGVAAVEAGAAGTLAAWAALKADATGRLRDFAGAGALVGAAAALKYVPVVLLLPIVATARSWKKAGVAVLAAAVVFAAGSPYSLLRFGAFVEEMR